MISSTTKLVRHSIISLDILPNLKNATSRKNNEYLEINGVSVKITSQRYKVFQNSLFCYKCGIKGEYFAIEKPNVDNCTHYHLNLYGKDKNGNEILLTKDHVHPKSKGGKNHISNYRTCCEKCNKEKADIIPHSLLELLPYEQKEMVFNQDCCDIDYEFLGFTDVYEHLSKIIPKHFTVIDLGCAYNPQCFYFTEHKKYIAVDYAKIIMFKSENCDIYNKNIMDFIKDDLDKFNLEETFAICSYVPEWNGLDYGVIKNTFKNLYIFYPSSKNEKLFKNNKI